MSDIKKAKEIIELLEINNLKHMKEIIRLVEENRKLIHLTLFVVCILVVLVGSVFFSPVPVRVGDVCLSCWGW